MDYLIFCITVMSKNLWSYTSTNPPPADRPGALTTIPHSQAASWTLWRTLGNRNAKLGLFSSALLRVGVMNALTSMVSSITRPGSGFSEMEGSNSLLVLEKSYRFMIMTLFTVRGRCYTVDVIREGLLRVIVLTAAAGKLVGNLKFIFEKMLPNSLLYYYGLRVLNLALQDLESYGYTRDPKFIASPAFDAWTEFEALAEERLTIFRRLATGDSPPRLRGCDKQIDWHQGQHRKYCDAQTRLRLGSMKSSAMGTQPISYWSARWARERAFLRALLTHDYHTMKYHFIHSPECTMFLTMFDYSKGPRVRLEIQCVEHETVPRYGVDDPLWQNALL
ncbi:hypothetical protein C8R47DRAFT_1172019, partial [Mycena vitilis]